MSWKVFLYDWNGANKALFIAVNQGLPYMLTRLAWLGSTLGSYWGAPLALTTLAWRAQRASRPGASQAITLQLMRFAMACLLAFVLTVMLKLGLNFPRPPAVLGTTIHVFGEMELHRSFPSGHSVYAALLVGTLWRMVPAPLRSLLIGYLFWVGWSRIAVGAHFPADVLAGWLLGFGCVWAAQRLVNSTRLHQENDMQTEPSSNPPQTWLSRGAGWWSLALLLASADQAIKYAVHSGMPYGASIPLTDFFNFVHRWNTGAAFSFLAEAGGWQRYLFTVIAIVVSAVLIWMLTKPQPKKEALGYSLILGGALGNVVDRINRGYVVDFLDFHWQSWHWPAFNLADIGICVGAALLIVNSFRLGPKHHPS
ncbi:MAG: lipoprotein signal peptidase [Burkholderiales bacterium]|nr:lipoprotein signal peptidase [Burkholderiales bacterium]